MDDQLTGPGDAGRSPMQNQNPFEPPATIEDLPMESDLKRHRSSTLAFAAVVVSMALQYFPVTITHVFQTGDIRNTWGSSLLYLCLLAIAGFFMFVEFKGSARSMRFLPIPLGLLGVLTLLIVFGVFSTISSSYFSLTWVFQNPEMMLGWLMCPIVWYYSFQCFMRRRALREQLSGEPLRHEPRWRSKFFWKW